MQNSKCSIQHVVVRSIYLVIIVLLIANAPTLKAQVPKDYYCNARFGFCVQYDPAVLRMQPESQNGDGCVFQDLKGGERLSVYGSGDWNFGYDGEVISLAQRYQQVLKDYGKGVTYKVLGKTTFTISGTNKGEVFYLKAIKRKDAFCTAHLHYAPAAAEQYKKIVELIAKTFR